MDDRYGLRRQGSGVWRSFRDTEFQEEDIWDVLNEKQDSGQSKEPSNSVLRRLPTAAKMIPRTLSDGGSSGCSNNSSHESKIVHVHQQSAPLNIPDWSKISHKNKKTSKNNASNLDDDHDGDDQDKDEGEDDEDEESTSRLPPHELIARRRGRSQISSFSVFEGAGRTLKGRDLSKMRNAILTKTGFLESL